MNTKKLSEKFTFYYIYINTLDCIHKHMDFHYLHSTIFILIRNISSFLVALIVKFTFYYIYINTEEKGMKLANLSAFTFYYIYINTILNVILPAV